MFMHGLLSSGRWTEKERVKKKKHGQCVRSSYCLGLFWTMLESGLVCFGSNFATHSLGLRNAQHWIYLMSLRSTVFLSCSLSFWLLCNVCEPLLIYAGFSTDIFIKPKPLSTLFIGIFAILFLKERQQK